MDNATVADRRHANLHLAGSFDHAAPQEQMKAIGAALQMYFEGEDWLARRDRGFSGLSRTSSNGVSIENV